MTCDACPHDIDRTLVEIAGKLGGLTNDVARVQHHVEGLRGDVVEVREIVASQRERVDEHTTRLAKLEKNGAVHAAWRARLGGAWTALAIGGGVILALAGLAVSLFR